MNVGADRITCFISSSSNEDRSAVVRALSEMGVAVTSDLEVTAAGSWASSLTENLRRATFVCVIVADRVVGAAIMYEAGVAVGMGRPLVVVEKTGADSSLAQLSDAPVIRYKSDDDTTLLEGLQAYVGLISQSGTVPTAAPKPVSAKSWSRKGGQVEAVGDSLERFVASALEASGALVAIDPALGDAHVDMTASFPVLGVALNPVLIEVKATSRGPDSRALRNLREAMERHGARLGILVTKYERPLRRIVEASTAILAISASELEGLSVKALEQELVRMRNEIFHGAPNG